MARKKYNKVVANAVRHFWKTKELQLSASSDKSNRGAVVGGKQLDGFLELLRTISMGAGVPATCKLYLYKRQLLARVFPFFKDWDFLVISPNNKLIAVIELKSQVGSYGNNFNNRTEEAIGSAVDLWTAFRKNQFPNQQAPWVGYLMMIGKDKNSTKPVRNHESHYPVLPEFVEASYIDRYKILCQKLILERHYTSVALLWSSDENSFGDVSEDISIDAFLNSFSAYLKGHSDEFK